MEQLHVCSQCGQRDASSGPTSQRCPRCGVRLHEECVEAFRQAATALPLPEPRVPSPRPPVEPGVVGGLELSTEVADDLKMGLQFQLDKFLRRKGLSSRLEVERDRARLRILGAPMEEADARALMEEVEEKLVELLSLREKKEEYHYIPGARVGRVIGHGGDTIRTLRRNLGVCVSIPDHRTPAVEKVVVVSGTTSAMEEAREELRRHLDELAYSDQKAEIEKEIDQERSESVAIFLDFSNLAIGAQTVPGRRERDFSQRLSAKNLTRAIVGTRTCVRKMVVGSKPPGDHGVWNSWRREGYTVSAEQRDADTGREVHVDAKLVGEALMHVMNSPPGILVLGTGDGNLEGQAEGTTAANFQNLVRTAAVRLGWKVEVWSWKAQLHGCYYRMAKDPSLQGRVKIRFLDGLRHEDPRSDFSITFSQGRVQAQVQADDGGEENDYDLCVVCLEQPRTWSFRPCGHTLLCQGCVHTVLPHRGAGLNSSCFICREPWTDIVSPTGASSSR